MNPGQREYGELAASGDSKYLKIRARQMSQRVRVRVRRKSAKSHSKTRHSTSRTLKRVLTGATVLEAWLARVGTRLDLPMLPENTDTPPRRAI
jgi:hypothetical protein